MLNKKVHGIKNLRTHKLLYDRRLGCENFQIWNFLCSLQRGKKKSLDETMTMTRIEVRGDTNWFVGGRTKARRGPVKWMKRKLFNVPVWRGRFLPYRLHPHPLYDRSNPFARTTLPDRLLEKSNGIFWLPSVQSRYLHIKISLTPSLKIILRLPLFFSPTLMRSRRIGCVIDATLVYIFFIYSFIHPSTSVWNCNIIDL